MQYRANLCQMTHAVGDAFSLVDSHPSVLDTAPEFKELLALPGIYVISLDQCPWGAAHKGRCLIVTNQAWIFELSSDCSSSANHEMWDPHTRGLSPGVRMAWSKLFGKFLGGFVQYQKIPFNILKKIFYVFLTCIFPF